MSSSTNSMRIAEIFTQAGLAFNKLGELTMTLSNNSNSGSASKWSDAEIAMLRDAVSRFGRDLQKLTEVLRNKSVAQIRNQLRRKEFKEAGFNDPGDLPSLMLPLKKEPETGDTLESGDKTQGASSRRRRASTLGRKQMPPQKRRKVSPSDVHEAEDDDEDEDEEEDDEDEDENPPGISKVTSSAEVGLSSSLGSLPPPIVTMSNRPSSSTGPARPPLRKQMGSLISRQPIIDEEEDDDDDEDDEDDEEGMDDEADTEPGYGTSNLASPSENAGLHNQQAVSDDIEEDEDLGEELDEEDIDVKEEDDDEEEGEDYLVDEDESEDGIEDEENLNM